MRRRICECSNPVLVAGRCFMQSSFGTRRGAYDPSIVSLRLAVAILVAFVSAVSCNDSSSDASADVQSFITAVETVCEDTAAAYQEALPGQNVTSAEAIESFAELASITSDNVERIREIDIPDPLEEDVDAWLTAVANVATELEAGTDALRAGDALTADVRFTTAEQLSEQAEGLAATLELDACRRAIQGE